jgi:hypothetical protein
MYICIYINTALLLCCVALLSMPPSSCAIIYTRQGTHTHAFNAQLVMYVAMYVWIDVRMYVNVYVCIYLYVCM